MVRKKKSVNFERFSRGKNLWRRPAGMSRITRVGVKMASEIPQSIGPLDFTSPLSQCFHRLIDCSESFALKPLVG